MYILEVKDSLLCEDITWAIITDDDEDKEDGCWGMREGDDKVTSQWPDMWGPVTQAHPSQIPALFIFANSQHEGYETFTRTPELAKCW